MIEIRCSIRRFIKKLTIVPAALLLASTASIASAADVSRDIVVEASPSEVWDAIGPFCSISIWYPGIDSCTEEQINGATHRRLLTGDGNQFLERLVGSNDASMEYSYSIEEGPLPVADYESTLSVSDEGGKARVTWSSNFAPKGVSEDEAKEVIVGIYDGGLQAIRDRFANQ
jgi:hypothetical protein